MFNKVILVGNLGKDPEVKFGQSGKAYCNLSLATSRWTGKKDDKSEYATDWHSVTVFGATAEYAGKNLHKGSKVLVEGPYIQETYEKDGVTHYSHKVLGDKLVSLDRAAGAGSDEGKTATAGAGGQTGQQTATAVSDDDIPF